MNSTQLKRAYVSPLPFIENNQPPCNKKCKRIDTVHGHPIDSAPDHSQKKSPLTSRTIMPSKRSALAGLKMLLFEAFSALSCNRLKAAHVTVLKRHYGTVEPLLSQVLALLNSGEKIDLNRDDWTTILKERPQLLCRCPAELLDDDDLYAVACVASCGGADILRQLPDNRRQAIYTKACEKHPSFIKDMPPCDRTPTLCRMAFEDNWQLCAYLPEEDQTEAFYRSLCQQFPTVLCYMPEEKKTRELCLQACAAMGSLLGEVPLRHRDRDMYETACNQSATAFLYMSEQEQLLYPDICTQACQKEVPLLRNVSCHLHSEQLFEDVIKSNPLALQWVPKEHRSPKLCELACKKNGRALEWVPDTERNRFICEMALAADCDAIKAVAHLPDDLLTEGLMKSACEAMACSNRSIITDKRDSQLLVARAAGKPYASEIYRILVDDKNMLYLLPEIPEHERTLARCSAGLRNDSFKTEWIPNGHIGSELLFGHGKRVAGFDIQARALALMPGKEYESFLYLSALENSCKQIELLTWPALPTWLKSRLARFLATTGFSLPTGVLPGAESLHSTASPLTYSLDGLFLPELLAVCHTAHGYTPGNRAYGLHFQDFLKEQLQRHQTLPSPAAADLFRLKHGKDKLGNRTVKVREGEKVYHYKFQRQKESLATLLTEGLVHAFRAQQHSGPWSKLCSDLPADPCFFELDEPYWPTDIESWNDKPEMGQRPNGSRYINVYRYTATDDYSHYAHKADNGTAYPYRRPEEGLLKACYDMGIFAGMGLPLTSTLPAFHNDMEGRSWAFLHGVFHCDQHEQAGRLIAWNSSATEHPDIGVSGLRDVGDFEPFGHIDSLFGRDQNMRMKQPEAVGQRLALANTLGENLVTAILLRARLRQKSSDYYYRNEDEVDRTALFIRDAFHHLLAGMQALRCRPQSTDNSLACTVMGLTAEQYHDWSRDTARELLYWTAEQPDNEALKKAALTGQPLPDCYARDLIMTGRPSTLLYPQAPPLGEEFVYPDDFQDSSGHLNLGAANATFPLTTLLNGLTKMAGGVIQHRELLSAQPGPESMEWESVYPKV